MKRGFVRRGEVYDLEIMCGEVYDVEIMFLNIHVPEHLSV